MATYGTLQRRFSELSNLERQYWIGLREGVEGIVHRVSLLLALRPPATENLKIGVVNEAGGFELMSAAEIPQKSRQLEFSLQLTLSEEESEFPPNRLLTHWKVEREQADLYLINKGLRIRVETYDNAAQTIVEEFSKALEAFDSSKKSNIS